MPFQQGLLATPVPAHARHLFFTLQSPEALPAALDALLPQVDGVQVILGVGAPMAKALGPYLISKAKAMARKAKVPKANHGSQGQGPQG